MAAFDTTRTTYGSAIVAGRISRAVQNILADLAAWNDARITRHALSALSDRELKDIGLIRGDIDTVTGAR